MVLYELVIKCFALLCLVATTYYSADLVNPIIARDMSTTFHVTPPDPFNFSDPNSWPRWIKRFERFKIASGLATKGGEIQVDTLIYCMGEKADDIFASFQFVKTDDRDEAKEFDAVKNKFEQYFIVRHNTIYERAKFNLRVQGDTEPVDSFITDLYTLSEHCNYGTLREQLIRDRIVVGIKDRSLSEKMQMNKDLTLTQATDMARHSAQVKVQFKEISAAANSSADTLALHSNHKRGQVKSQRKGHTQQHASQRTTSQSTHNTQHTKCQWCGKQPHDRSQCPAKSVSCHKCKTKGHFAKVCRGGKRVVNELTTELASAPDAFLGALDSPGETLWTVPVSIRGREVTFRVDTGADVSVISKDIFDKEFPGVKLQPPTRTIRGADRKAINTQGSFHAKLHFKDKYCYEDIYIFDRATNLLSCKASHGLGIVSFVGVVAEEEFPKLFNGLGKLDTPYNIELQEGARPYAISTPRRIPIPLMPKLKHELGTITENWSYITSRGTDRLVRTNSGGA